MNTVRLFVLAIVSFPALLAAQELSVSGLKDTVEILTDRWGVAHIYAKNEHDLFFAQGYSAAKDRTFQFELWRRQATGTVAEILGRRELDRDIGTRLHMFRKDMTQELNHYHPHGEAIINAYVDGVNAFIDDTERDPGLLSMEFALLGIKPGKWTPAVVISRHQGLLSNVTTELRIGRAVAAIGPEKVRELDWFRPGEPVLALDPVIDAARLEDDILHYYNAFRRPVLFEPEDLVASYRNDNASFQRLAAAAEPFISNGDGTDAIGSNNWVVSGRLTQTGYPYVVNDPHRTLAAPSLRYFVHLHAPGWNVIGGGEPVLPGISIGHNEVGAWGLTVFGQDNEDLYVYETNPANPNQYRYLDGWEDMRVIEDTIAIKGEAPETVELKYTRHGPVLYEDEEHNKAYALRAAWMEIGSSPYLASLRMNQAKTWKVLAKSFSEAITSLTERLGSDMMRWQYGQEKFKHVLIHHPLSPAVDVATRAKLDVGPAPRGGYGSTLKATSGRDNQRSGASFCVIMDVANWDNSIATSAPGQAGNPDSPHYRDLFELFVKDQYFPLFFSREKIESVTESRTVLAPARATDR